MNHANPAFSFPFISSGLSTLLTIVAQMGETRNAHRILVGKPEGKRPIGRPRRRWVDNIKMDLSEMGWYGLDLSGSG
jgi:hypothetical protein